MSLVFGRVDCLGQTTEHLLVQESLHRVIADVVDQLVDRVSMLLQVHRAQAQTFQVQSGYRFITRPKDYRGSIAKRPIEAIQPIFRVTWADPNTDIARDDNWGLTPGIQIFFYGRNKLALNYDIALCADDTASASSFKMLLAGYF